MTTTDGGARAGLAGPEAPAGLAPDAVLEGARALVPRLRERITETEQLRQLPAATMRESIDAEIFSLILPRSLGGAGGGLREYVELMRILAAGDPTAAWVLGFFTTYNWFMARWPAPAQQEIFAGNGPTRVAGVANPPGRAEPAEGGYLVSGCWGYCSGVMHAEWVEVVAVIDGDDSPRKFVLPRAEVDVHDTWRMLGMIGTGSHHVELNRAFVPSQRSFDLASFMSRHNPGSAMYPEALYSYDVRDAAAFMIPAIIFGTAEALLELYRERLDRRRELFSGTPTGDTGYGQLRYARAVAALRAARAVLDNAVTLTIEANAGSAASLSDELRAHLKLDCLTVCRMAWESVELGLGGSGSSLYQSGDITQHFVRDMQVAMSHLTLDHDVMAAKAGEILLGRATGPEPARHCL
jgi:alkylation response protein AidB-like acyl-CoA dehydrogenase